MSWFTSYKKVSFCIVPTPKSGCLTDLVAEVRGMVGGKKIEAGSVITDKVHFNGIE